jgi:glucosamine--fructose-6-phosphate aminotransferase (isomerizing)
MCGIIGILGKEPVASALLQALRRLEYRGYDSAGVATLENGQLHRRRAEGKLRNLEACLLAKPLAGCSGIGHTRWATHGAPSERNAHPHATNRVAVVHNGIIENHRELKAWLEARGVRFETDTDTEVVAHLITLALEAGNTPIEAVRAALHRLEGAYALVFLFDGEEDLLIGARRGSPLAIGSGTGETFLGSDAIALAPLTAGITYLEDGDLAILTRDGIEVRDANGAAVRRTAQKSPASTFLADKGNHRHFMSKEIYEQPEAVSRTLAHYLDFREGRIRLPQDVCFDFARVARIALSACGTAYYAALVARYWLERLARLPVDLDVASEFRYREPSLQQTTLGLFVSQSGETADTVAALRYCAAKGLQTAAVVNVQGSTIGREAKVVLPTLAGPEIGVASTKAFTCQLSVLASLAIEVARARGAIGVSEETRLVRALIDVPRQMTAALRLESQIREIARKLSHARTVLYLGRGTSYPVALEGALKLKEISYIHAEGYAAGELKHGPIALIDDRVPVVVIAPTDTLFEKTASNMQEVAARGGRIILITDAAGAAAAGHLAGEVVVLPSAEAFVTPLLYAIPVQLIAYHTSVLMGRDVDQPRNLAKSVTVE